MICTLNHDSDIINGFWLGFFASNSSNMHQRQPLTVIKSAVQGYLENLRYSYTNLISIYVIYALSYVVLQVLHSSENLYTEVIFRSGYFNCSGKESNLIQCQTIALHQSIYPMNVGCTSSKGLYCMPHSDYLIPMTWYRISANLGTVQPLPHFEIWALSLRRARSNYQRSGHRINDKMARTIKDVDLN